MLKAILWIIALAVLLFVGTIAFNFTGTLGSIISAPGRVIQQTLQTDNIIQSYETFYDRHEDYKRFVKQYSAAKKSVVDYEASLGSDRSTWTFDDKGYANHLRTVAEANRSKVNEIVAKYNADSSKMNVTVFKGWDLPADLDQID